MESNKLITDIIIGFSESEEARVKFKRRWPSLYQKYFGVFLQEPSLGTEEILKRWLLSDTWMQSHELFAVVVTAFSLLDTFAGGIVTEVDYEHLGESCRAETTVDSRVYFRDKLLEYFEEGEWIYSALVEVDKLYSNWKWSQS